MSVLVSRMSRFESSARNSPVIELMGETPPPVAPGPDVGVLLERCLRGDHEAWQEFIDRYHRVLEGSVRAAYWRTLYAVPEADVANVVQDLYARLFEGNFRRLRSYQGRCPFALWLRSLATHHALNTIRDEKSRGRHAGGELDSLPLKSDEAAASPEEAEKREDLRRLRRFISQLGPLQKTVLEMLYYDGETYQVISRALGIPVQTIGSLITRARARLRQLMAGTASAKD